MTRRIIKHTFDHRTPRGCDKQFVRRMIRSDHFQLRISAGNMYSEAFLPDWKFVIKVSSLRAGKFSVPIVAETASSLFLVRRYR